MKKTFKRLTASSSDDCFDVRQSNIWTMNDSSSLMPPMNEDGSGQQNDSLSLIVLLIILLQIIKRYF